MDRKEFESCLREDFEFKVQKIGRQVALDRGLLIDMNRLNISTYLDYLGNEIVQSLFSFATQEEEVYDYPADWWEWFKQRWFPKWLLKRYPIKYDRVWAIHKFPELNIPNEFIGREFVHFRIIDTKKLERLINKNDFKE